MKLRSKRTKSAESNTGDLKPRRKVSLLIQVFIFFLVSMLLTAALSDYVLSKRSYENVVAEKEELTLGVSYDTLNFIVDYYSYDWVIEYLLEHKDEDYDFEYDASYDTDIKAKDFVGRHPGVDLKTIFPEEIETFSPEDQKTYVEIVYNRWVTRFDELILSYNLEFLYIFATDNDCVNSIFIINGARQGLKRGTEFGDAYVFGVEVVNNEQQHDAFSSLEISHGKFVFSDGFMDYNYHMFNLDDKQIFFGVTYKLSDIEDIIDSQTSQYALMFVGFQLIMAVICMLLIVLFALRPLRNVERKVKEYADTKDGKTVVKELSAKRYRNEIGTLSDGIRDMIVEIDGHIEHIAEVTAEKERFSAELNIAARIQANMLPSVFPPFPEHKEFDLYASMTPAKEVGGDFYDFFMIDDTRLAMVMADVSGKGVPAALFMVVSRTLIKNRSQIGGTPGEILRDVNEQLCEGNESGMFVTVWLAILDITTGKGIAANAGHEHPALMHDGRFELVEYFHSPMLATFEGLSFREHEFELQPGDRLFVYTDGVPEATDAHEEPFGTERMLDSLNRNSSSGLKELLTAVKKDIDDFVGEAEQFDDVTMLCIDYFGPASE